MQASSRSRSGRRYPGHGPLVREATEEGFYTLRCLACGVKGPEREDTLKAKLAFDETFVANDCYSPTFREVEFSEVRSDYLQDMPGPIFREDVSLALLAIHPAAQQTH